MTEHKTLFDYSPDTLEGPTKIATATKIDELSATDRLLHDHRVDRLSKVNWEEVDPDIVLRAYRLIDQMKRRVDAGK